MYTLFSLELVERGSQTARIFETRSGKLDFEFSGFPGT